MTSSVTENHQKLLTNISNLQKLEENLINNLDTLTRKADYDVSEQTALIDQINNLSDSRISLFETLNQSYDGIQNNVSNSRTDLVDQLTLVKVVEDQLSKAKETLDTIQNRNDTKMRMVEVNTYYGERYEAHTELMKMLIMVCIPLLILFILKKKSLLPELISNYAIGITIAVGAFFIIRALWDISNRNNMNFGEYDWKYEDPSSYAPSIWEYNKKNFINFENPLKNLVGNLGICVGSDCCSPGLTYDEVKKQCKAPLATEKKTSCSTVNGKLSCTEAFGIGAQLAGSPYN
jgi:hypothetical protein